MINFFLLITVAMAMKSDFENPSISATQISTKYTIMYPDGNIGLLVKEQNSLRYIITDHNAEIMLSFSTICTNCGSVPLVKVLTNNNTLIISAISPGSGYKIFLLDTNGSLLAQ